MKNETVKGIIGKTQGVKSTNIPPTKPRIKMLNKPPELSEFDSEPSFKSSVFFKSNCNCLVKVLLFSSIEIVSSIKFPAKESVKFSSIFIQAVSQTWPKKFSFIWVIFLLVN